MRHRRYDLHRLALDGRDLPLAYGDVLVVERSATPDLQWELVVVLLGAETVAPAPYLLELRLLDGRTVTGEAILVRFHERMAVFRGTGPLHGLDVDELA